MPVEISLDCSELIVGITSGDKFPDLDSFDHGQIADDAMDPACQVGTVQGHEGSIMVWGVFSWHSLGSLVLLQTSLNAIPYIELLGDPPSVYAVLLSARKWSFPARQLYL
ncbi:hypothetical protein TNCV_4995291 [Trichonephila clavipes]|nr:hypothetical protein TNCV_4995291 [Trichonephila clavipes]